MIKGKIQVATYYSYKERGNILFSMFSKNEKSCCKVNSQQGGFQPETRENFLTRTSVKSWNKLMWKIMKAEPAFSSNAAAPAMS